MSSKISIIRMGWGVKQGRTVKNWKRRWFVFLSNGKLRYFQDKTSVEEQGALNIEPNATVLISPSIPEGIPIQIVTKARTLIVAFPTSEEAQAWEKDINAVKSGTYQPESA